MSEREPSTSGDPVPPEALESANAPDAPAAVRPGRLLQRGFVALAAHAQLALTTLSRWVSPAWNARQILRSHRDFFKEADAESRIAAQIPEGERVGMDCVWIVELYLASHAAGLIDGLNRLSLANDRPWAGDQFETLRRGRVWAHGGWLNLGHLVPVSDRGRYLGSVVRASLPLGVRGASLGAVFVVPGATVVVAQFWFDQQTARSIEAPFGAEYSTTARRSGRATVIHEGARHREESVSEARASLRRRCARWMHDNLPGAYARFAREPVPSAELITVEIGDPLNGREPPRIGEDRIVLPPGPAPRGRRLSARGFGDEDYLEVLGLRDDWEAWACAEMPGLTLRLPRAQGASHTDAYLTLATRLSTFGQGSKLFDGVARTPEGVVAATRYLQHSLALYGLHRITSDYEARLARVRDKMGEIDLSRPGRAVGQMQQVEQELALLVRDLRPLLSGIFAARPRNWLRESYTFVPIAEHRREDGPLFAGMAKVIAERAKRLSAEEAQVRETAQAISGLLGAAANLKLARRNVSLQVVAIIFSILAVMLAAIAIPGLLAKVIELLREGLS